MPIRMRALGSVKDVCTNGALHASAYLPDPLDMNETMSSMPNRTCGSSESSFCCRFKVQHPGLNALTSSGERARVVERLREHSRWKRLS